MPIFIEPTRASYKDCWVSHDVDARRKSLTAARGTLPSDKAILVGSKCHKQCVHPDHLRLEGEPEVKRTPAELPDDLKWAVRAIYKSSQSNGILAEAYDCDEKFVARVKRGDFSEYTDGLALNSVKKKAKPKSKPIKRYLYKGKEYRTGELAALANMSLSLMSKRLQFMTPEAAVETPLKHMTAPGRAPAAHQGKKHPYKGEMLTISELAERSPVEPNLIRTRLATGWTLENAVDTPKGVGDPAKRKAP